MTWGTGHVARATAIMDLGTEGAIQNVFHVQKLSGSGAVDDAADAIIEMLEDVYTELLGFLTDDLDFEAVNILLIDTNEALGNLPWPTLTAPTNTQEWIAPGVAALNIARTGVSRRFGRKYFGPFCENHSQDGAWVSSLVTAVSAACDVLYSTYNASNGIQLVGGVYDRVNDVFRTAQDHISYANPAYQRRRRLGVGI